MIHSISNELNNSQIKNRIAIHQKYIIKQSFNINMSELTHIFVN